MNHYFKRRWNEPRADEHSDRGESWWLFEADDEFWPVRQIEVYDNGRVLTYHEGRLEDEFGGLSQAALDPQEFAPFRIDREAFESEWERHAGG